MQLVYKTTSKIDLKRNCWRFYYFYGLSHMRIGQVVCASWSWRGSMYEKSLLDKHERTPRSQRLSSLVRLFLELGWFGCCKWERNDWAKQTLWWGKFGKLDNLQSNSVLDWTTLSASKISGRTLCELRLLVSVGLNTKLSVFSNDCRRPWSSFWS